jgi:hypothetical protein
MTQSPKIESTRARDADILGAEREEGMPEPELDPRSRRILCQHHTKSTNVGDHDDGQRINPQCGR